MKRSVGLFLILFFGCLAFSEESLLQWPAVESVHKPWTRWWWHGNAVDSLEIERQLHELSRVGIGGVELTSIYGVRGQEQNAIPYLSDQYLDVLKFTAERANELGLGVDIPPGSGWRCGGLGLDIEYADARVVIEKDTVHAGDYYRRNFDQRPQALAAFSEKNGKINLLPLVVNQTISWQPREGTWTIYLVTQKWSGAEVKRPAPGGEGYAFNPYSKTSTERMLQPFSVAFAKIRKENIRAIFHDSFEYSGDWTSDFLSEFENRRGYDLSDYLPELTGVGNVEIVRRVKCDYRETISDLVRQNFLLLLKKWSNESGWLLRNQSHGSPANLLDLYGTADIPETEIFRFDRDLRVLKFASSAANVTGKQLVSAESFTWQDEHFHVTLDTIKRSADLLFVAGINHIFFHGTAYSPQSAEWPGWLFYASSQINPQNTIWTDLPAFNSYVARCQSVLQTSQPDNDVLIYWPVYDVWSDPDGLNKQLAIHHPQWISENPAGYVAEQLIRLGVTFDFISDRQLKSAQVENGIITFPSSFYQTIIVPDCEFMPLETLNVLLDLAKNGAVVLVQNRLPIKVPGLKDWQTRQKMLSEITTFIHPDENKVCAVGRGRILFSDDLGQTLEKIGLVGEPMAQFYKLLWLRKKWESGALYFLSNQSDRKIENWLPLNRPFASCALFDPMTGERGLAKVRDEKNVYLQLDAGASIFLKTYDQEITAPAWTYWRSGGDSVVLVGVWKVDFISGGPELPRSYKQTTLGSWTLSSDPECARFAGTASYSISFDAPAHDSRFFELNLGRVAESARIVLNEEEIAVLFTRPFSIQVELKPRNNKLEIYVTNLAANRIRDLDRREVPWRIFYDINFVTIDYEPFDASEWPVQESGLLGPVSLRPLSKREP